jgi:hypothetical protein
MRRPTTNYKRVRIGDITRVGAVGLLLFATYVAALCAIVRLLV